MTLADGTTKVLKHIASHVAKNLASFESLCSDLFVFINH